MTTRTRRDMPLAEIGRRVRQADHLRRTEARWESLARGVDCPTCKAGPGEPCCWTIEPGYTIYFHRFIKVGEYMATGHTGRYRAAFQAGLLPEFAWLFDLPPASKEPQ